MYDCKTKTQKVRRFYKEHFVDFEHLMKIEICWGLIFEILIIHKPSLGPCEVSQKFDPDQFNKQIDKQSIYIDRRSAVGRGVKIFL